MLASSSSVMRSPAAPASSSILTHSAELDTKLTIAEPAATAPAATPTTANAVTPAAIPIGPIAAPASMIDRLNASTCPPAAPIEPPAPVAACLSASKPARLFFLRSPAALASCLASWVAFFSALASLSARFSAAFIAALISLTAFLAALAVSFGSSDNFFFRSFMFARNSRSIVSAIEALGQYPH